ncbi:MAG: nucleoside hydrolase [Epulopiscium sp.]|nr:nucleoside hydrolase [Candidatus Epulonipiscium sp.]
MGRRTFIIDCDTGTDDAIAIIAALYSKDMEVVALTSVNGNVAHQYTSKNNLNLVEYLKADQVLVAKGAEIPLYPRGNYYGTTHGQTGLGTITLPEAKIRTFCEDNAIEMIRKEAKKQKGNLELLVIGPMTNIAMAISLYPEIISEIKHIWFMGGAVRGGNVTTTAEFNIWVDPVAAKIVINSGIPMTMVGLDVTERAILNRDDEQRVRKAGTKASILVADILEYMFSRHSEGGEDAMMHDALALAAAIYPECLTCIDYYVDVECEGVYTAGHTMVDVRGKLGKKPNVSVAVDLDINKFKEWLIGCIESSV